MSKKILVIEDDPAILIGLETALKLQDYEVIKESDGIEGLESALKENPDLVILDIMLPNMNGFQICTELKNRDCTFPIFMLTSMDNPEDKLDGLSRGADDYICKPFNMQELLLKIRNALKRTSLINDRAKKFEEDLIKIQGKVNASSELKNEFLSILSHEIRTPINVILGNLYLLKEELEGKLSEDQSSSFDLVDLESRRFIRTVDSMILLSELQQGNYDKNISELSIQEVLQDLIPLFHKEALSKNIDFRFIQGPNKIMVQGDRYSISMLLNHLISNAVKFTEKGSIELLLYRNQDNNPSFQVRDTGVGIADSFLPKLYEPFAQEDSGYSKNYEGNGIGLTLVKKCCELNGAEVFVETKKHKGSTFTVVFM